MARAAATAMPPAAAERLFPAGVVASARHGLPEHLAARPFATASSRAAFAASPGRSSWGRPAEQPLAGRGGQGARGLAAVFGAALLAARSGRRRASLGFCQAPRAAQARLRHRVARPARGGEEGPARTIPIVLLSGFLGTGKTTLLKHWLENSEGRIGVVVNDVASVNIDAKLVDQQKTGATGTVDTIQLQNGCACCSLGDELITTIYDLISLTEGEEPYSQIIIELSGVAEPKRVRDNFEQARLTGLAGPEIQLSKVVTLIDSSTFCKDYMEYKHLYERPDIMEDDAGELAEVKVVELLVEQVEEADVVVLNKTDLADSELLSPTRAVIAALNEGAVMHETTYGRVSLNTILAEPKRQEEAATHEGHGHEAHGHEAHGHEAHGHEAHGHEAHGHEAHGHDGCCHEDHGHAEAHSHSHEEQGHSHSHDCSDPTCTDPSHGHTHSHSHDSSTTTAEERFGITSFVYTARRPFHSDRLAAALQKWPVPNKECLGQVLSQPPEQPPEGQDKSPFEGLIRSKGFCWLDAYPNSRMFWSQAGKSLVLEFDQPWWGSFPEQQQRLMDETPPGDYARAKKEEWSDEWADRRQEIVFIGQRVDEVRIRETLDGCLLTDGEEMEAYLEKQEKDSLFSDAWAGAPAGY